MSPRRFREPRTDLFKSVRYFLDESIGGEERDSLHEILRSGGATRAPSSEVAGMRFDAQTTHVITGTLELPEYEQMNDAGVAFVTTKWVTVCWDMNQIHEPRFYSLDPRHIFSGVVVCCDELPGRDADHVKAIVAAYGGQFRGPLTRDTTHLVTIRAGSDRYHKAMKHAKRLGMKVVLPHWIYDSLRAAMRVPERPFLFPDPPLFHPDEFDPKRGWKPRAQVTKQPDDDDTSNDRSTTLDQHFHGEKAAQAAAQTWDKYIASVSSEPSSKNGAKKLAKQIEVFVRPDVEPFPKIFQDKLVYMVTDLNVNPALERCLEERIKAAGGSLCKGSAFDEAGADDMLRKADWVVAQYRTGWEYWMAWELGKLVGNIHWLIFCLATGRVSGPRDHLLHYPVPKDSVVGFDKVVATLTNYTGQERDFLKRLIETMGGTFDGELRSTTSRTGMPATTLLVAAQCQGAKVDYAIENEIQIVNHTWLERCFTRWSTLSYTSESIFCDFPTGVHYQERVGRQPLPKSDVLQWTQKTAAAADRQSCQMGHEARLKELRPSPGLISRQATPPPFARNDIISIADSEDDNDGSVMNVDSSPVSHFAGHPTGTLIQSTSREIERQLVPESSSIVKPSRPLPASRERTDLGVSPMRVSSPAPSVAGAPASSRLASEVDPKDVLESRAGRAAKVKAAVGVSAQGKDMRAYEEQRRKNKRRSSAAADMDDEADMLGASTSAPPKKRNKAPESRDTDDMDIGLPDAAGRTAKGKGRPSGAATRVKMCQTGDRLDDATMKGLKELGVVEAKEDACTHMCLSKAVRNEKFLVAMCRGARFVSHEWAVESVKAGQLLDAADFPVNEEISAAEQRARTRPPVFAGQWFHISSKRVSPDYSTLCRIIEAAGGKMRHSAMKPWPKEPEILEDLHIISCDQDKNLCRTWLKQSPQLDIRVPNYVLDTVKHQDKDWCDESTLLFTSN